MIIVSKFCSFFLLYCSYVSVPYENGEYYISMNVSTLWSKILSAPPKNTVISRKLQNNNDIPKIECYITKCILNNFVIFTVSRFQNSICRCSISNLINLHQNPLKLLTLLYELLCPPYKSNISFTFKSLYSLMYVLSLCFFLNSKLFFWKKTTFGFWGRDIYPRYSHCTYLANKYI